MKDNYSDEESLRAQPEFGKEAFENENVLGGLEQTLSLLSMIDPQAVDEMISQFGNDVQERACRMGLIAATTGQSALRAGTKFITSGNGAVMGYLVFAANNAGFINAGMTPEQGIEAVSGSFRALNDFFQSLKEESDE